MKVGFYLDNSTFASVDCTTVSKGNPGIGGTEYMFLLISSILSARDNGIDVTFFTTFKSKFPKDLNVEYCDDLNKCIIIAESEGFDFLVIKHDVEANIHSNILDRQNKLNTQVVVWAHVFMCYWELDYYASNPNISKIVNVGRETLELNIDHKAYDKSTYIFNAVNPSGAKEAVKAHPFEKRGHVVTYIGQLSPFKGFHLLAKSWKKILEMVPDAQLFVIGSGKLYDKDATLGPYNIASSEYESQFMPYLTDDNGRILDCVHFMGVMGEEKNEILLRTKVGVPNPSGITETFCISAVEMQLMGARIATYKSPGFIDTVRNGILGRKRSDLADNIIRLLNSHTTDYDSTVDYIETNFSPDAVVTKWEDLFFGNMDTEAGYGNICYRLKWAKIFMRNVKRHIAIIDKRMPVLERILLYIERKLCGPVTYLDSNNTGNRIG